MSVSFSYLFLAYPATLKIPLLMFGPYIMQTLRVVNFSAAELRMENNWRLEGLSYSTLYTSGLIKFINMH